MNTLYSAIAHKRTSLSTIGLKSLLKAEIVDLLTWIFSDGKTWTPPGGGGVSGGN